MIKGLDPNLYKDEKRIIAIVNQTEEKKSWN